MPEQQIEISNSLRQAMRTLASTVSLVTTATASGPHGIAVTSFTSVSLDPPTILVCINRGADFCGHVREAGRFCINVLSDQHEQQCQVFGSGARRSERFTAGEWSELDGMPILADARAVLACETFQEVECGSHITLFASVNRIRLPQSSTRPLVYLDGKVSALSIDPIATVTPTSETRIRQYG